MKNIKEVLTEIALAVIDEMNFILEHYKPYPVKNSRLAKTFDFKLLQARTSGGQFAGFTGGAGFEIIAAFYAPYLDGGRRERAKKVPIRVLLDWVKRKNIRFRNRSNGKFISSNSTAYIIQNSIYKNGIKGRNFIKPALDKGDKLINFFLDNDGIDYLTQDLDKIFNSK